MKKYVIIGNGVAAAGCVEGIRKEDKTVKITVISEEKHAVYCRPLISYYLEGKTDLSKMPYREADFYKKNGCDVILGAKAALIDPENKTVRTDAGDKICYDALCVASGSSPFIPPFEGLETVKEKFTFLTLDDALALEKATLTPKRVLIAGAGLIGLKCAEGLKGRASEITVFDLADRALSSILDADSAKTVQTHLENNGIRLMLKNTVSRFESGRAIMKSGEEISFDLLVLAVGVRANSGLIKACGGNVNRGIIVDTRMKTSLKDVYSAGDCAEGFDSSVGANKVLALLPNAYMQGYTAGINMAGGNAVFDTAIPMNSIGFFGLHMMTAGVYEGDVTVDKTPDGFRKLFIKDNLLKGFILIGGQATERAGIYTSLIRDKTHLDSVDLELIKACATSAAFSKEKRKEMFGGGAK